MVKVLKVIGTAAVTFIIIKVAQFCDCFGPEIYNNSLGVNNDAKDAQSFFKLVFVILAVLFASWLVSSFFDALFGDKD
jgi:hypothetical protein